MNLNSAISRHRETLSMLEKHKCHLAEKIVKIDVDNSQYLDKDIQSKPMFESMIRGYKEDIRTREKEVGENKDLQKQLSEELKSIDSNDLWLFKEKSTDKYVSWWKPLGYEK